MQLATIAPFLAHLKARGHDVERLLGVQNLALDAARDPARLVQAEVVYGLLETFAQASGDPWLGVHVAEQMDMQAWPITREALAGGETLGHMFTGLILSTPAFGTSVRHRLEIEAKETAYVVSRKFRPRKVPLQVIGFGFAVHLRFLDLIEGGWSGADVVLETPSARALPAGYRGVQVRETGGTTQVLRFPSRLLRAKVVNPPEQILATLEPHGRPSLTRAIAAVAPDILARHEDNLPRAVAEAIGLSPEELESGLAVLGTSLPREMRRARLTLAREALQANDAPVADIAARLGFSAAANFTRFFKTNAGETPRAYRQRLRADQAAKR
ncbi:helix-turn-helix transcriptional regulator [Pseudoruegeria sp. SHC-113]|uniref:helix-turn-helix transcriptional regulator n=1 Tax=Pseudoruegeria sp. SHC-113 TaxID=2855439 RepID=UPI0021BB761C|nr:AraC family transcriptional regulator [Pseudoruegeria sp. SHC-113]MCT8159515.1 AraC family transcriptional regulator [Pseudoruegeria sp. SHC-113]